MKGMLFGGCSFSWGQGLYFYSDLPDLYNPKSIYEFPGHKVTDAQIRFKNTLYYPRLVSNHFNTFEVTKPFNGGSDDETFDFFKHIFDNPKEKFFPKEKRDIFTSTSVGALTYNDFEYIVIQLSAIFRNEFYFNIGNETLCSLLSIKNHKILEYMKINNYTFEDCCKEFFNQQFNRLKKELMFYESRGIKSKIVLWFDDLLEHIKNDEFLKDKVVIFNYDNKNIYTIKELQDNYPEMLIISDPYFKNTKFNDAHPSKLCHEIISKGIINSIEADTTYEK
jgi:hypothetical protein